MPEYASGKDAAVVQLTFDCDARKYLFEGEREITLASGTQTVFELSAGQYHLVETKAPTGYDKKETPVIITVTEPDETSGGNNVSYDEGTTLSEDGSGKSYDEATGVVTLMITNTAGVVLPQSGGIGTTIFYILGSVLVICSGIYFVARKRARS